MKRRVQHLETTGGAYVQLRAVGSAMGFEPTEGIRTTFKLDSQTCTAELDIDSGNVTGIVYGVRFEGPEAPAGPTMVLRRELVQDKEDKEKGLVFEVQLQDEDFDFEIYVDSNAAEPEVKRFLARPEARAGARWLIDLGIDRITVDRKGVKVKMKKLPAFLMEGELERLFESMLELSKGGSLRGAITRPRNTWLPPVSVLTTAVAFLFFWTGIPENDGLPMIFSGLLAAIFGFVATRAIARKPVEGLTSGHSSSGRTARFALGTIGLTGGFATGGVVLHLIGAVTGR
ncbi:MAG: hypothetical protein JNM17_37350 [Archangium sp.]|nr:hypothetical protein [Archangium sp.]